MLAWPSLVYAMVGAGAAAGGFSFVRRFGGSAALAELERANRILVGRVHELEDKCRELLSENAILKAKTDVTLALAPVVAAITVHEEAAAKRSDRMLDVLDLIGQRLGREATGG